MGVDIHMNIIKSNGTYIEKEIFDGRNSEWFDQLCGRGEAVYEWLPVKYNFSDTIAAEIKELEKNYYYGFRKMCIDDFINWFEHFHPEKKAGWVHLYDKWAYENGRDNEIVEIYHYLPEDVRVEDMVFFEWEEKYNNFVWLKNYLTSGILRNKFTKEDFIFYYFDC